MTPIGPIGGPEPAPEPEPSSELAAEPSSEPGPSHESAPEPEPESAPEPLAGSESAPEPEPELSAGLHGRATAEPGWTYRILRRGQRAVGRLLGFRFVVEGLENLPRDAMGRPTGGWIAAGMPHRTWIDPFVPWAYFPARPRLSFFGDARTMARAPWRRWILARLGGVIPIPAGHDRRTVQTHFSAAAEVLRAGGVFCLFPETGPATPPGTIRRLGAGIGYIAVRNRAPIVPFILGGTHELFFGRTIVLRVLPVLDPWALAGIAAEAVPAPDSPAERDAVHALLDGLAALVAGPVLDAHERGEPPPGSRKRGLRLLTGAFR